MRIEDGPAAALVALLLQTLGRGFAQRQVWFGARLDVGRVGSVHGLVEGLGDGRAAAGLQREHTRERGLSVVVSGRACCRDCRRYHGVAIEAEEEGEKQERIINNSLPPRRHYFRGVAALEWCCSGRGGDEGAGCTAAATAQKDGLPHACMHGRRSCLQKRTAVRSNEDRSTLASLGLL